MDIDFYCIEGISITDKIEIENLKRIAAPALLMNLQRYDEASFCYEYNKAKSTNNFKGVFGQIFGEGNNALEIGYRSIDIASIMKVLSTIRESELLQELQITYEQPCGYELVNIKELLDYELYLSEWITFVNNISKELGCLTIVLDW